MKYHRLSSQGWLQDLQGSRCPERNVIVVGLGWGGSGDPWFLVDPGAEVLGPSTFVMCLIEFTTTVPNVEDHQQCRFSVADPAAQLTAYVCFVV